MISIKYANFFRKKRETQGYSQQYVAEKLFVSRNTISSWENGRTRPEFELLRELIKLYDCEKEETFDLFFNDD